jgi:hypothetical protein
MLNDFLPAIVSVGILGGVFLFGWISDVRRIQRLNAPELDGSWVIENRTVELRGCGIGTTVTSKRGRDARRSLEGSGWRRAQ